MNSPLQLVSFIQFWFDRQKKLNSVNEFCDSQVFREVNEKMLGLRVNIFSENGLGEPEQDANSALTELDKG